MGPASRSSKSRCSSKFAASTLEGIRHPLPRGPAFPVSELNSRCLDLVELVGDAPVIGLQLVDHRTDGGVRLAQPRKQEHVLGVVVHVYEAAVAQAVDLQLPERAVCLEILQLGVQPLGRQPVEDLGREPLHRLEVAPDRAVHPEQLLEERASLLGLGRPVRLMHSHSLAPHDEMRLPLRARRIASAACSSAEQGPS